MNSVESSSAMNVGTNLLIGFGSGTKTVQGNGQLNGDEGEMLTLVASVDDRDQVDTPNWEVGPGGYLFGPTAFPSGRRR